MQKCSFTEFRNELARVLGTRQRAISKASVKPVSTRSVEVESGEEDALTLQVPNQKGQKDKCTILPDQRPLEQIRSSSSWEFPNSGTTFSSYTYKAFTNALMASKTCFANKSHYSGTQQPGQGKPFLGKRRPSKLAAGKDGVTNPEQSCRYCKDTGHLLENCLNFKLGSCFLLIRKSSRKG